MSQHTSSTAPNADLELSTQPWWHSLTRYHWFVFVVAALGWLFDTMDQQLFTLARQPAMMDLLHVEPTDQEGMKEVRLYGGYATAIFLIGWATGGLGFGIMGDRVGRAKTMVVTILMYSIFTGLSALSQKPWQFMVFRFLTGLGVGGEFAVGVALLAEVMPDRARPFAIGWLQSLSAVGNITAALIALSGADWRTMFIIGSGPALLALFIRRRLKEPEKWQEAVRLKKERMGSYSEMFGNPRWRRNALVGLALAFVGVVGLWGIAFFSFDLIRDVFYPHYKAQGLSDAQIGGKLSYWVGIGSILQNVGGFFGIHFYSRLSHRVGRRPAFLVAFLLAATSTAGTFWYLGKVTGVTDIYWMLPILGFCQLSMFGGYAIYFPELFPTRLRSTGTSFCYNVGRFVASVGPFTLGHLARDVYGGYGNDAFRYAALTMCSVFLIGLAALPFAPETRGQPLPE
ncbi:MAG: MFS transporter [Gemmataceae bacterium]|nr:MFS transporter [Gemmataceae bacterium]